VTWFFSRGKSSLSAVAARIFMRDGIENYPGDSPVCVQLSVYRQLPVAAICPRFPQDIGNWPFYLPSDRGMSLTVD
jgi:hypothetical protein